MTPRSAVKPRKQPSQSRSRATVEAILDATAQILVEQGYAAASTNRVAERAGISIGSLYQYFPGKQALVVAVRRRHAEQMLETVRQHSRELGQAPPSRAARVIIHGLMRAHLVDPKLHRVLHEEVPRPELTDGRADIEADILALVKARLIAHRERILPSDPDLAAVVLVRLVETLIHSAVVDQHLGVSPERAEEEIVAIVLRYLGVEAELNGQV